MVDAEESAGRSGLSGPFSWGERLRVRGAGSRRRWVAVVAVVVVVGAVWGLIVLDHRRAAWGEAHLAVRQPAREGDPAIPAIDWPNGLPDHGRWADDPWVQTLREFQTARAVARNTGQVSDRADLQRLASQRFLDKEQYAVDNERAYVDENPDSDTRVRYYPGPRPFEVLDVTETESGAEVSVCTPNSFGDLDKRAREQMVGTAGYVYKWYLKRAGDGRIVVTAVSMLGPCEVSDVHYGLFDPQPEGVGPVGAASND